MVDLTEAGRRLAAYDAGPTTPLSTLQHRAKGRTRRRRALTVVGAATLAAIVVVGALHLSSDGGGGGRAERVVTAGIPGAAPSLLPTGKHPAGWSRHVIGELTFWAPPTWYSCNYGSTGPVAFEPMKPCPLGSTGRGAPLVIRSFSVAPNGWVPARQPPPAWTHTVINHVSVFERSSGRGGATTTYEVPALDVILVATTPAARQVARTLGVSSRRAVLRAKYPVAVPAGWKTVEFGGVTASVPGSWPVKKVSRLPGSTRAHPNSCTVFFGRVVYLGHIHTPCTSGSFGTFTPGLWLGTATYAASSDRGAAMTSSTVMKMSRGETATVTIRALKLDQSDLVDLTISAGGHTVAATMGLGVDPAVAEEIISSFRSA